MGAPCSGFRSLITAVALGLVYVYINKSSLKNKAKLIASIIPFALAGNLVRVTGMCLVTFYFGESTGQKFHDISGFFIFLVLILGLVWLESMLTSRSKNEET
jgi:exosortase/archaeosortase family protein